jgi:hypothetical protein
LEVKIFRLDTATWTAIVLFAVMAVGSYLRLFVGVGILGAVDEAYWVGNAILTALGGQHYYTETFFQQTASLLYEPLALLYHKFFGTFGIVLFVRHLYFALVALCTFLFFKYFRSRTDLITSLAIASVPLVGTWRDEPSLSYSSVGSLGFGTGMLLAIRGIELGSRRLIIASGIFFAFCVGAFPTFALAVALFWLMVIVARSYLGQSFWKEVLIANATTSVLLAAFGLSLIARSGFDNILFSYQFTTTGHSSLGSLSAKLIYGFNLWLAFLPPLWVWVSALCLWWLLWMWKALPWQIFAVAAGLGMLFLSHPPEEGPIHAHLVLLLALSGLPLVLGEARRNLRNSWGEIVLYSAALISVIVPWWTSALTIYTAWFTTTYCLATIYYFSRKSGRSKYISLLTFAVPLTIFVTRTVLYQRDDYKITGEVALMTDGPFAGIFTSPMRAEFLDRVQADVNDACVNSASILFYNEFPIGYLMSPLRPATRTLYLHTMRESGPAIQQFFREYYFDPAKRPDVIFRFKYYSDNGRNVSMTPDQFKPYVDVFWNYLPSEAEYTVFRDRDSYTVFKKKSLL